MTQLVHERIDFYKDIANEALAKEKAGQDSQGFIDEKTKLDEILANLGRMVEQDEETTNASKWLEKEAFRFKDERTPESSTYKSILGLRIHLDQKQANDSITRADLEDIYGLYAHYHDKSSWVDATKDELKTILAIANSVAPDEFPPVIQGSDPYETVKFAHARRHEMLNIQEGIDKTLENINKATDPVFKKYLEKKYEFYVESKSKGQNIKNQAELDVWIKDIETTKSSLDKTRDIIKGYKPLRESAKQLREYLKTKKVGSAKHKAVKDFLEKYDEIMSSLVFGNANEPKLLKELEKQAIECRKKVHKRTRLSFFTRKNSRATVHLDNIIKLSQEKRAKLELSSAKASMPDRKGPSLS